LLIFFQSQATSQNGQMMSRPASFYCPRKVLLIGFAYDLVAVPLDPPSELQLQPLYLLPHYPPILSRSSSTSSPAPWPWSSGRVRGATDASKTRLPPPFLPKPSPSTGRMVKSGYIRRNPLIKPLKSMSFFEIGEVRKTQ
jgi:hypothetical protein